MSPLVRALAALALSLRASPSLYGFPSEESRTLTLPSPAELLSDGNSGYFNLSGPLSNSNSVTPFSSFVVDLAASTAATPVVDHASHSTHDGQLAIAPPVAAPSHAPTGAQHHRHEHPLVLKALPAPRTRGDVTGDAAVDGDNDGQHSEPIRVRARRLGQRRPRRIGRATLPLFFFFISPALGAVVVV